ncbi:MAG TPA: ferredoxin [Thermoplasmata archaeon]|jgi:ferredoxin
MPKCKLEIVRGECTGCELCTSTCEGLFEMAYDGLSTLKGGHRDGDNDYLELDDPGCGKQAAEECPAACIHLYEDGNKVV